MKNKTTARTLDRAMKSNHLLVMPAPAPLFILLFLCGGLIPGVADTIPIRIDRDTKSLEELQHLELKPAAELCPQPSPVSYEWLNPNLSIPLTPAENIERDSQQGVNLKFDHQPTDWLAVQAQNKMAVGSLYRLTGDSWEKRDHSSYVQGQFSLQSSIKTRWPLTLQPLFSVQNLNPLTENNIKGEGQTQRKTGFRATTQLTRQTRLSVETAKSSRVYENKLQSNTETEEASVALDQQIWRSLSAFSSLQGSSTTALMSETESNSKTLDCGLSLQLPSNGRLAIGRRAKTEDVSCFSLPSAQYDSVSFYANFQRPLSQHWLLHGSLDYQNSASHRVVEGEWLRMDTSRQWNMEIGPSLNLGENLSLELGYRMTVRETQEATSQAPPEHRASIGLRWNY
ncbi:MAG: hypothetical protein PHV34_04675 [Verrucomicrobiae bacterium]|nr:hypothetical protein [Verrucomicrobiae bacterium]